MSWDRWAGCMDQQMANSYGEVIGYLYSIRNKEKWIQTTARRMLEMGVELRVVKRTIHKIRKGKKALRDKEKRERAKQTAAGHVSHNDRNPTAG